nr:CinA family protein [Chitinophaga sp.]
MDLHTVEKISTILQARQETLSVAESVSAGLMQTAFSSGESASSYFQGGITTYNLGQKARHLQLNPIHGDQYDCVSSYSAKCMAENCCHLFLSEWAIGITGYASLVPDKGITSLYAYYSIAFNGKEVANRKINADAQQNPYQAKIFYVNQVIREMENALLKK